MRTAVSLVLAALLAAAPIGAQAPPASLPEVTIGLVVDGPWAGNAELMELTRQEIQALTEGEFDVRFPADAYLVGDWSPESAERHLDRLLADPEVDLIITWGILASNAVCCAGVPAKPVVAPVIIDVALQGLPLEGGASGVDNLSYVALPDNLERDLRVFLEMVPFRKVAFLSNRGLLEAVPDLPLRTRPVADELGIDFQYIGVGRSADEVLAALADDTDAVYVWPIFQLPDDQYLRLIEGINELGLPSFSALGGPDLELGMLASVASKQFFPRLTRRVALNVQRILLGENAGEIPVGFSTRDELTINMATARRIGVSPTWDLLIEANVLYPLPVDELERRTLVSTIEAAVAANLDLRVKEREVAAGAQEGRFARSAFRPRLDLGAQGLLIDSDRAAASLGSQAERTWSASAILSQLVWSEPAAGNLEIQRQLQQARREELQELRLDIVAEAATTYLNLLRAISLVQVRRNNLEVSRSNLELAQIRRTIGAANPAEVYRWESQIAADRQALLTAVGDQSVAEIALNRLLHVDQGTLFLVEEVGVDDPSLMTADPRFVGYTETPRRFQAFTDFLVEEGIAASPEVAQVRAAVAAQERLAVSARRAYWSPEIGLQARFDEILSEGGAGSGGSPAFELFPLPQADDSDWSLGLQATLPLYAGGAREAEKIQADEDLARLRELEAAIRERIEQRIRTAMARTRSSYPGIELSRQAAAAARQSLELVRDAYARGAVSIIDLLDAQTTALNADELATNSVYDFLVDLMEAQRATNRFDFFLSPMAKDDWFSELGRYFEERGIPPLGPRGPANRSRSGEDE